jgi:hypothetical protein
MRLSRCVARIELDPFIVWANKSHDGVDQSIALQGYFLGLFHQPVNRSDKSRLASGADGPLEKCSLGRVVLNAVPNAVGELAVVALTDDFLEHPKEVFMERVPRHANTTDAERVFVISRIAREFGVHDKCRSKARG